MNFKQLSEIQCMSEKQKVLIVDDEPRNVRIIAELLEGQVDFKTASNGEDALKLAESYLPDLILLDIMMPGMDGYQVCKELRTNPKLSLTKVILVTGKAMIEELLQGYEVGANDYMTKPFVHEELLAKVKVFLRLTQVEKQFIELNSSLESKVKERTAQLLETEAKLTNAARMSALGEMAGGMAHEINTPLGTIAMISEQIQEMINQEPIERKTVIELTEIVRETIKKINLIISGLRTFSRDGSQDHFVPVSVKKIIDGTLILCSEKIKHSGIQIEISSIPDDLVIQCREVQISQVLLNLLSNSCDAIQSLKDKWIKIAVQTKGNRTEITVTDSGAGISEQVVEKLFQPFFTTKEVGKGTGLGLSISKGIIDAHKGKLSVDRNCKNTRFVIELPNDIKEASCQTAQKAS